MRGGQKATHLRVFPCAGNKKEAPPKRNLLHYLWWRRREVRAFAPRIRDRCGASRRLARSAGKRSAFPQLRALSGSIPVRGEQKRGPAQAEPLTLPVVEQKLLTANTVYANSVEIKVTRSWFAVVAICEPNNKKG
nr:MAG TPA: hypothetical protein [Caudoviricetes sp.]